ncbi:MAG: TIGR01777 family protein [Sandaracinus sp.]|nr:TIGR01777 family protein [Sandaracinus sp.]|tara:strand:- start:1370 stop:2281 length:912 start_codon:yes stop_codon:yes gene_type:complete
MTTSSQPPGRTVAITGATGLVGTALRRHLENAGWTVRVLSRSAKGSEVIRWDPQTGELDRERLEGVDAVVHLAGENVAGLWTEGKRKRIRESRVKGTTLLAEALSGLEHPPDVLVSASAVGYYGDRGQDALDESAAPGDGFLSEVCVAWEASASPAAAAGIRVVHPRIGIVLAEDGGALQAMKTPFKLGLGGRIGSGQQLMAWVHLEDLVRMLTFAIENPAVSGVFNAVAPEPVSNAVFTETLGDVLSRPTFIPVPGKLAKLAMGQAADEMLLASTGAVPEALEGYGFEWKHPELKPALADVL